MDAESESVEYLSVRETAARLGVHENTVRNWAKPGGPLQSARVPGSSFNKFDSRDVERLRQQRGAPISSVARDRLLIGPELVNATQLSAWSETRDAQDGFPELVRRLLVATPGLTQVSVRAGEGVAAPDWDGFAMSSGTDFLPDGELRLELGVGARVKGKADTDFEKRKAAAGDGLPVNAKFVFLTPRRWANAAAWAAERRREGIFADVVVLDADDIEGWLATVPAVHHWLSERLGRQPRDAQSVEQWWERFRSRTNPPLPRELFLAGREEEAARLERFLDGSAAVVTVQSSWRDESLGFVAAVLDRLRERVDRVASPALIVGSDAVWERVTDQPGRQVLLPTFDGVNVSHAVGEGHHVIVPTGPDSVVQGEAVRLSRPDRQVATASFESEGVELGRASELAALARRSMPSLVRTLAKDPAFKRPAWAQGSEAAVFGPLVLVGSWRTNGADLDVVTQMVGRPWEDVQRTVQDFATTDDPPIVASPGQWQLASPAEALLVLRDGLTRTELERWHRVVPDVLVERDPRLRLAMHERPMAGLDGVAREHSDVLRRGLAQGLAMMGATTARLADGVTGEDHARVLVRSVLGQANGDSSGEIWRSLSDILPLLAEAAPSEFLDHVWDDLDRPDPLLASMFQDQERGSGLYSSSPHTGLLWALETLCWNDEYLLEATGALARLEQVDPGGHLSNRPLRSLGMVLVLWIRHTGARLATRIEAVESICDRYPDVGWRLVLALWPTTHATSFPPSSPRFRDWKPAQRSVSVADWTESVSTLVRRATRFASEDSSKWQQIVDRLGSLPSGERAAIIAELDRAADGELPHAVRLGLWEQLHTEVARHRRFSDADWAMPEDVLERLQAIADRIEPKSNVERYAYLFDWRPDLPGIDDDRAEYDSELARLRGDAVKETIATVGIDGLRSLALRSRAPSQLGLTVGEIDAGVRFTPELLTWLDSDEPKLSEFAYASVGRLLQLKDVAWMFDTLKLPSAQPEPRRARILASAPATPDVWDAVEADEHLHDLYWSSMHGRWVEGEDAPRAVRELLAHDRPWVAVDLISMQLHPSSESEEPFPLELLEATLDAALESDPDEATQVSLGYELGLILDEMEKRGVGEVQLAKYEFNFFSLLQDSRRRPKALFSTLASHPELFVDFVSRIYRGRNEPARTLDEREEALAHHSWWVLAHWDAGFPGQVDGRVDDELLRRWVKDARDAFAESDRADIGDEQIGQVLARSPVGDDGIWPAEAVRSLIEDIGSQSIETGLHVGVYNGRGVTSRGVYDGGSLERREAQKYADWARQTAGKWRRTTRVLRDLATTFERDAQREDDRARIRGDSE